MRSDGTGSIHFYGGDLKFGGLGHQYAGAQKPKRQWTDHGDQYHTKKAGLSARLFIIRSETGFILPWFLRDLSPR